MSKFDELKTLNPTKIIVALSKAANDGDIDLVKHILINYKPNPISVNHAFYNACTKNQQSLVQYLLYSDELKNNADVNYSDKIAFIAACEGGLETVKLLMPLLDYDHDIMVKAVSRACSVGKLEIIEFLLAERIKKESADIGEEINTWLIVAGSKGDINTFNYLWNLGIDQTIIFNSQDNVLETIIINCSRDNNLDMIKHLFNHEEIKNHINLDKNKSAIFKFLCEENNEEMVKFLIFDLHIQKNEEITVFLNNPYYKYFDTLFEKRDLNNNLNNELNANDSKVKKAKI